MTAGAKLKTIGFLTAFLTIAAGWPSVAPATPVTYIVDFSGAGTLPNPAQGVFMYDAGGQFSNFLVGWNGTVFDLTSKANAPSLSGTPCAGEPSSSPAVGFALLSKTLPCAGTVYNWAASKIVASNGFAFSAGGSARSWQIFDSLFDGSVPVGFETGVGDWTIATAAPGTNPYQQFLTSACSITANYSISFSGAGKLPSTGCFNYDAATSNFSNFLVSFDDMVFNLTGEANAPSLGGTPCAGEPSSSPAVGFALLSKTLPCAGTVYTWLGTGSLSDPDFEFFAGGPARSWKIRETLDGPFGSGGGFGDWTISATGPSGPPPGKAPEPSTISLVLAALLLFGRSKILEACLLRSRRNRCC